MPVHVSPPAGHLAVTVRVFSPRFSATRRGARLARRLAVQQLDAWGFPYGCGLSDAVGLIVGELAANAVTHGRVPGRDFELRLALRSGALHIEVADTRTERRPPCPGELTPPPDDSETGRGLLLVAALAARWEVRDRDAVGKVVRAELDL
ncbi:ATP-binding protein [Streptomyces sioyaensis]|uniref:ATP-binding protein n=1 Tax=Streptomyces sioyaensis TaxID=67364 RepID=UPI0037A115D9